MWRSNLTYQTDHPFPFVASSSYQGSCFAKQRVAVSIKLERVWVYFWIWCRVSSRCWRGSYHLVCYFKSWLKYRVLLLAIIIRQFLIMRFKFLMSTLVSLSVGVIVGFMTRRFLPLKFEYQVGDLSCLSIWL